MYGMLPTKKKIENLIYFLSDTLSNCVLIIVFNAKLNYSVHFNLSASEGYGYRVAQVARIARSIHR